MWAGGSVHGCIIPDDAYLGIRRGVQKSEKKGLTQTTLGRGAGTDGNSGQN